MTFSGVISMPLTAAACLRASHTAIPADERQTNAVLCVLGLELIREAED